MKLVENFTGHPDQKCGHLTYSQHGEDLLLWNLAQFLNLSQPSYLDLGAHHPWIISNTAFFYERGSRGVNVEANPRLIANFLKYRPEDTTVNLGVGPKKGVFPFYYHSEHSGLNSFQEDSFAQHRTHYQFVENVAVTTINDVVQTYCQGKYPDFLLTDLEDWDFEVLASADFSQSKPKVICTEMREAFREKTRALLEAQGFTFYCKLGGNLFFVQTDLYPLCR